MASFAWLCYQNEWQNLFVSVLTAILALISLCFNGQ